MRINSISPIRVNPAAGYSQNSTRKANNTQNAVNYQNQVDTVSFGRFLDENADKTMHKTLLKAHGILPRLYPNKEGYELIRDTELLDVSTSPKKKIQGEIREDKIEEHAKRMGLTEDETEYVKLQVVNGMKRDKNVQKALKDLGKRIHAELISNYLKEIAAAPERAKEDKTDWMTLTRRVEKSLEEANKIGYAQMRAEEEAYRG